MNDDVKVRCRRCGAVNLAGAPTCHGCGRTLTRSGLAVRPVDEDDEDEPPRKSVQKGPPPKKKPAPPIDDADDEEERRPAKKPKRRDEEPEEEVASIRDNPILNMFFPVGVSLWAMGANYLGLFATVCAVLGFLLPFMLGADMKILGYIVAGLGVPLGFIALILGGLSFVLRPKKSTYGSLTGYVRALVGMGLGLIGLVGGPIVIFFVWKLQF